MPVELPILGRELTVLTPDLVARGSSRRQTGAHLDRRRLRNHGEADRGRRGRDLRRPDRHLEGRADRRGLWTGPNGRGDDDAHERIAIKRRVGAGLGLWDWGSAAYNAVICRSSSGPTSFAPWSATPSPGGISGEHLARHVAAAAGLLIAVLAPVTGQRADAGGRRKRAWASGPALIVAAMLGLFLVQDDPLPVARPGAARPRLDLLRVRLGLVQRDAAPGLDAGEHRPGLRLRLVDGLLRRHRAAADLLRRVHRARRRLVRGDVRGRPEHPDGGAVRGDLVRRCSQSRCCSRCRRTARPGVAAGRLLRLLRVLFRDLESCTGRDRTRSTSCRRARCSGTDWPRSSPSARSWPSRSTGSTARRADLRRRGQRVSAIGALVAGRFDDRVGPKTVIVVSLTGLISGGILLFVPGPPCSGSSG